MRFRGPLLASLIAPLVSLLPLLAIGFWEFNHPSVSAESEPDDAPMRAFGVFLVSLPILYVLLCLLAAAIGGFLFSIGYRSIDKFLLAATSITCVVGAIAGYFLGGPTDHGGQDALYFSFFLALLSTVLTLPSAGVWWLIAGVPPNPSLQATASGRA